MEDLDAARTTAIAVAAVGQTLFVLVYLTFPWWRSFLGRALFFKALAFALLLDFGMLARMTTEWVHEDQIFITLYALFAVGVWGQLFAFLRTRTRGEDYV